MVRAVQLHGEIRNKALEEIYTNHLHLFEGNPLKPCDDPYNAPQDIYVTTRGWRLGASSCYKGLIEFENLDGSIIQIFLSCDTGHTGICWRYYKICWETDSDGTQRAKVVEIIEPNNQFSSPDFCTDAMILSDPTNLIDILKSNPDECVFWCQ